MRLNDLICPSYCETAFLNFRATVYTARAYGSSGQRNARVIPRDRSLVPEQQLLLRHTRGQIRQCLHLNQPTLRIPSVCKAPVVREIAVGIVTEQRSLSLTPFSPPVSPDRNPHRAERSHGEQIPHEITTNASEPGFAIYNLHVGGRRAW